MAYTPKKPCTGGNDVQAETESNAFWKAFLCTLQSILGFLKVPYSFSQSIVWITHNSLFATRDSSRSLRHTAATSRRGSSWMKE